MALTTLERLESLVQIIESFVNGPAEQTITINSGQLRTLKGIEKLASQSKYLQKVVDYKLKSQADSDAFAGVILKPGMLASVYGEANKFDNGLFEVQEDKTLLRVDYKDIYNLGLPSNGDDTYRFVSLTSNQIQDPAQNIVARYKIAASEARPFINQIEGTFKCYSSKAGFEGATFGRFSLVFYKKGLVLQQSYQPSDINRLAVSVDYPATQPTLTVEVVSTIDYDEVIVRAAWPDFLASDPVKVEFFLDGINKNNFM